MDFQQNFLVNKIEQFLHMTITCLGAKEIQDMSATKNNQNLIGPNNSTNFLFIIDNTRKT